MLRVNIHAKPSDKVKDVAQASNTPKEVGNDFVRANSVEQVNLEAEKPENDNEENSGPNPSAD